MKVLVTGGAGFIGRWLIQKLLDRGDEVCAIDNFYNGRMSNIEELTSKIDFIEGDIKDRSLIEQLFARKFDLCYHLAACINVQESLDTPQLTFDNDVTGTFNVLELARQHGTKVLFMSTCMVYDRAADETGITEEHPTKSVSPYAACKIFGEEMTLAYGRSYDLPVVVVRPFNTYGPFQKSNGEGGVVAIFIKQELSGEPLKIYGDGTQTRDLLYVEDCADFLIAAALSKNCEGHVLNAGLGKDIAVNDLAKMIAQKSQIEHVEHIHPQSEIPKLLCNYSKAAKLLEWSPKVDLAEGIEKTKQWIASQV